MSNQKHCRGCPHLDFNEMSNEMYCKLKDYELIRLRWHKQRPDWCPLVTGAKRREDAPTIEERPTGEWIVSESEEVGALGIRCRTYTCPSCGWNHSLIISMNFCPNCGNDNRGEQDE